MRPLWRTTIRFDFRSMSVDVANLSACRVVCVDRSTLSCPSRPMRPFDQHGHSVPVPILPEYVLCCTVARAITFVGLHKNVSPRKSNAHCTAEESTGSAAQIAPALQSHMHSCGAHDQTHHCAFVPWMTVRSVCPGIEFKTEGEALGVVSSYLGFALDGISL